MAERRKYGVPGRYRRLGPVPRNCLVIMAKEPRMGRVKTRLARDIGAVAATQFYRQMIKDTVRTLGGAPGWQAVISVSPDSAVSTASWPRQIRRLPQGQGNLGTRMRRVFERLPPGPVVIIGTDIPGITRQMIAGAFRQLGRFRSVFGPARDGGYWLVGLKRLRPPPRDLFAGVRWSTEHALADSRNHNLISPAALADMLDDIDTGSDFERLKKSRTVSASR